MYLMSVCVWEREKKGSVKNDSLDDVHTNPDAFENTSFSLYFQLLSALSFPLLKTKLFEKSVQI